MSKLTHEFFGYPEDERDEFHTLESIAEYGAIFRYPVIPKPLDNGRDNDGTRHTFGTEESENRRQGNVTRSLLPRPRMYRIETMEQLLQSRALPCALSVYAGTSRPRDENSYKRVRTFPDEILPWREHTSLVLSHKPHGPIHERSQPLDTFSLCASRRLEMDGEDREKGYMIENVLRALCDQDVLPFTLGNQTEGKGRVDDVFVHPGNRRVLLCIEFKSTHNLRLPESLLDVIKSYANSDWRTKFPIAQAVDHMRMNNCRFGVLTSGTRTYFLCAEVEGSGESAMVNVKVSRRWYVAEPHYQRAWSAIVQMATENPIPSSELRTLSKGWTMCSRDGTPKEALETVEDLTEREHQDSGMTSSRTRTGEDPGDCSFPLPPWEVNNTFGVLEVDYSDIDICWSNPLGCGRNGYVYEGHWNCHRVALKEFYVDLAGAHFQHELEAYVDLIDLQGEAVARLLFVSRTWCGSLRILGLQLGDQVVGDEDNLAAEVERVHSTIERAGWRQPSSERRKDNHIWLNGQLVAIDLELLERISSSTGSEMSDG